MHRDRVRRRSPAGTQPRIAAELFAAELRDRGLLQDAVTEAVRRIFGVSRGAAERFIRSHPSWADQPMDDGPSQDEHITS